jgi:hypothetical protein
MSRQKRSPNTCTVEAIIWWDAAFATREKLDTEKMILHTVGFVVHEDESQVVLAHEVETEVHWLSAEMDYTKIPKPLIVKRSVLATVNMDDRGDAPKPVEAQKNVSEVLA